jgi:hypothetical protein
MPVLVYRYVISSILRAHAKHWRLPRAPCPACVVAARVRDEVRAEHDPTSCVDTDAPRRAGLHATASHDDDGCEACRRGVEAALAALRPGPLCDVHVADLMLVDPGAATVRVATTDCIACRARAQGERSALRDASATALCVAHAERTARRRKAHRTGIDLRLEVMLWELDELDRKLLWNGRAEELGAERDAWLRAPVLLDGRVALGAGSCALRRALEPESRQGGG